MSYVQGGGRAPHQARGNTGEGALLVAADVFQLDQMDTDGI